jgi:hypothetical protein
VPKYTKLPAEKIRNLIKKAPKYFLKKVNNKNKIVIIKKENHSVPLKKLKKLMPIRRYQVIDTDISRYL